MSKIIFKRHSSQLCQIWLMMLWRQIFQRCHTSWLFLTCLHVCQLSPLRQKPVWAPPSDLLQCPSQLGQPALQPVSHPHPSARRCPLTCANMSPRKERVSERRGGKKCKMKRYPGLWFQGGARNRTPHSWANLHCHRTSPVHWAHRVFSRNPPLLSLTGPKATVG